MSFQVRLYTLSKRDNSTKRPTGDGTLHNCVMKHGCGILNPSISLDLGLSSDPSQYNYAYIPAFGRYYFIEEWFFEDRLWTASMRVDVLATYKTEIGNSSLYVVRAAAAHDGAITDLLYPSRIGCNYASDSKANPWTSSTFVVGIVSKIGAFGSLNYYAMSQGQLGVMCANMSDYEGLIVDGYGFNPDEFSQGLQMSIVDPLQYIKTCVMLPVSVNAITNTSTVGNIPVYIFDSHASGERILPSSRIFKNYTFTIPQHPDTASRGNYVNSAPFTVLTLTIPPYGCIEIDTSVTANASTLDVEVEIDPITGKGILVVKCNNIVLNRLESQIGVPISLSQVTRDYIGAAANALGGVGGAISGAITGDIGGAFSTAISGIGNAIQSLVPRSQTIGSTGSFVSNRGEFRLDAQFFRPIPDDNVHNGRPLCQVRKLNTLSGYMLIQDGDVTINGTSTEDAKIRNYLEGGFYYE